MKKKILFTVAFSALSILISIYTSNYLIKENAKNKTFISTIDISTNRVGLVLGTTKMLRNGRVNLFYKYRVNAAVALYNSKKISFILVSGDNSNKAYDEPTTFKKDLIKRGICR